MAKQQTATHVREIFHGVRWNITIAIIVLTACSIFALALTLVHSNSSIVLTKSQLQEAVSHSSIETQNAIDQGLTESQLTEVSQALFAEFRRQRIITIYQFTPLIVIASGVVAYAVARQILRPIKDSYNAQERFLQDAAHEFRNPLAALKVTIDNIKQKGSIGRKESEALLKSTETQVNRLISINEDLLYLEKQLADFKQAKKVNVSELLLDVLEDLQSLANEKQVKLVSKIQEDIELRIRVESFIKIARNIVGNAIKYSKADSGEVQISLTAKNNKVRFSVRDFGVGIPSNDLAHIGRRFYRASNTSSFNGSGLGMAIVQKVVDARGGTITVNSKLGEGTHVVINL